MAKQSRIAARDGRNMAPGARNMTREGSKKTCFHASKRMSALRKRPSAEHAVSRTPEGL